MKSISRGILAFLGTSLLLGFWLNAAIYFMPARPPVIAEGLAVGFLFGLSIVAGISSYRKHQNPSQSVEQSSMNARRIFMGLLVAGLGVADVATILCVVVPGGSKYFGFAFGGLAAATLGGLGLLAERRKPG